MSTVSAVAELERMTGASRQGLDAVRPLVDRDGGRNVVVDLLRDACDDLDGYLAELGDLARGARTAVALRRFHDAARAMSACSTACNRAVACYVTGLGGETSLHRLRRLAADRPDAWGAWSVAVRDDVARLWQDVIALRAQVDRCWEELAEQLTAVPVEVDARVVAPSRPVQPQLVTEGSAGGQ